MFNKVLSVLIFSLGLCTQLFSQAPQKINYQAVVRNAHGDVITNTNVSIQFLIHEATDTGTIVYQENNAGVTNQFGLIQLEIGSNNSLAIVDWSSGAKYLQVKVDPQGGSNYVDMGTSQLLSVPYALFAANSLAGPPGATGTNGATGPTGPGGSGSGGTGPTGPTGPNWNISSATFNTNGSLSIHTTVPDSVITTRGAWLTSGNGGTNAATNFIGTTDNQPFVINTNNIERERVLATGAISVNKVVPNPNIVMSAYANGYPGALNTRGDTAIAGFSTTTNGVGVYGENINGGGNGVVGSANSNNGSGVEGLNTGNMTTGQFASGVFGQTTGTVATGATSVGVYGSTTGTIGSNAFSIAVYGSTVNSPSTGVLGAGNGQSGLTNSAGVGGAFSSDSDGLIASAKDVVGGTGAIALGNGIITITTLNSGCGVIGIGANYGVMGLATSVINTSGASNFTANGALASAGGYFEVDNGLGSPNSWAYVGVQDAAGTLRKIIGNGTVNTIVKDTQNKLVALSCPEAPENLFQDLGKGQLQNGKAHITLDPIFSKNIIVNEQHILRVFVQLVDECNGVYIANRDQNGFDVIEIAKGNSNAAFIWMVMANRADEMLADGSISKYSVERFAAAPGPENKTISKAVAVPALHSSKKP